MSTITTIKYACTFALDPAKPGEMQLLPAGEFAAVDGRPGILPGVKCKVWKCNEAIAARLIAKFDARKNPAVIDFEHQTQNCLQNGQPAPAAGWMHALEWRPESGLWATQIEWVDDTRPLIASKKYRYCSAYFSFNGNTGEVMEIICAGLTNNPGLDGMSAVQLARTIHQQQGAQMDFKAMLAALGLPETATEADVRAKVAALTAAPPPAPAPTPAPTQPPAQATPPNPPQATQAPTSAPEMMVPLSALVEVQTQMAKLAAGHQVQTVEQQIAAARSEGRLMPAVEVYARELGQRNPAELTAMLAALPPVVPGTPQSGGKPPPSAGQGEAEDPTRQEVLAALGRTKGANPWQP